MFLTLECFVMDYTCDNTDIIIIDFDDNKVLAKFNTDDEIDYVMDNYGNRIVDFVRPAKDGKLIVAIRRSTVD